VARLHSITPWEWGSTKPLAMAWADRMFGKRDRGQHAETHGIGKIVAELPPKVSLDDDEGEAVAELCQALRTHRAGGVVPHGTTIKILESMSQGWQIYRELIGGENTDIAQVLLGQDGSMTNEGGNYIKAAMLTGVRKDIVEGDLGAEARALNTGLLAPWAQLNGGPSLTITTQWLFPDPDEDERKAEISRRHDAFNKAIKEYRANGFVVDQRFVDNLAEQYGIPAPKLSDSPPAEGLIENAPSPA